MYFSVKWNNWTGSLLNYAHILAKKMPFFELKNNHILFFAEAKYLKSLSVHFKGYSPRWTKNELL